MAIRNSEFTPSNEPLSIVNSRFALDTLRVPNRSPTPILKINDFLGQSDDIWGAPGPPFPADFGGSRGPGRLKKYIFVSPLKGPLLGWAGHLLSR